jgi:hypothetical protein
LSEIFLNAQNFSWRWALYCTGQKPFVLDTGCAIFNPEVVEGQEGADNFARENELEFVMDMQKFRELIGNAKKTKKNISPSELLNFFNANLGSDNSV